MKDFEIPIDNEIDEFRYHLDTHDRTILSARFGDGKSYFLSKFVKDPQVTEKYIFLTIYPVNYQVVENRDIFELIKRDILLQMALKEILTSNVDLTDAEALTLYLQCKPLSFVESFLPLLTAFSQFTDEKGAAAAGAFTAGWGVIKGLASKIKDAKESIENKEIDDFLATMEGNPVVGMDVISKIIKEGINKYKEDNPGKKVVLVIEDMDRIDPRHIFRILNIFSAHIDYCYHLGYQPDSTLYGNKFGLDKVVFVLDYDKLKSLYGHFYGEQANFEGYIEKFCSSNHFRYSYQEEKSEYFLRQISVETDLPSDVLSLLMTPNDFIDMSVRCFTHAIDNIDNSILSIPSVKDQNNKIISFHPGILRLIVIFRKFNKKNEDILDRLVKATMREDSHRTPIFSYLAHYITLSKSRNDFIRIAYRSSVQSTHFLQVDHIDKSGKASCSFSYTTSGTANVEQNLRKRLTKLLKMVAE